MKYIKYFSEIGIEDLSTVGGKNAAIGQMIQNLNKLNVLIPQGFAITVQAYWYYLEYNKLTTKLKNLIEQIEPNNFENLQKISSEIRQMITENYLPTELTDEIGQAYDWLSKQYNKSNVDVAVRSSATAEDLPQASFAGQQDTFLNITGLNNLILAFKKCMASLFTDRAIIYRINHGFDHFKVGISVGIQKMIRSDKACSGVLFTLDTDTGFKNAIVITSSYGLGENIVKGIVNPDEFQVFKPTLEQNYKPIIRKYLGSKDTKLVYTENSEKPVKNVPVSLEDQKKFSLKDEEILILASQGLIIEKYYSKLKNKWVAMDIEWAKDGFDEKIYILQARPETVYSPKLKKDILEIYKLKQASLSTKALVTGLSIGKKIASGTARILKGIEDASLFKQNDILVATMTDPDWVPIMKKASAIVTNQGGRTCHAAIVSRELGIPAIIGTSNATEIIKDGQAVTIDCSQGSTGYIYDGIIDFNIEQVELKILPKPPVTILMNIADPDRAYDLSFLPVQGVGLARIEFIISNFIKIHPMAIAQPEKVKDKKLLDKINELAYAYKNPQDYFIDILAQGIGTIAAAFHPKTVLVRLSDFKTNEYRNLLGGYYFEPIEENPMLGFRGAVRYCSANYAPAFALECKSILKARDEMGLKNIKIMVPFVRTLEEAKCTIDALAEHNLHRKKDDLEIIMMCEVPSNVVLLKEFAKYFDGFSIGSNDLTQFTLAVDRDSALLEKIFNERDPAVKKMLEMAICQAKEVNKYISICGQAPSDYPEIADFLTEQNIDSISLNPDAVIPFLMRYK